MQVYVHIPVNSKNNVINSLKAGVKNLIVKPFTSKKAVTAVQSVYKKIYVQKKAEAELISLYLLIFIYQLFFFQTI